MRDLLVALLHFAWALCRLAGDVALVYYAWHGWRARNSAPRRPPMITLTDLHDPAVQRQLAVAVHAAERRGGR